MEKDNLIEAIMSKFKFILELKVGTLQINENQVSERIELNKSLIIESDLPQSEINEEIENMAFNDKQSQFSLIIDGD